MEYHLLREKWRRVWLFMYNQAKNPTKKLVDGVGTCKEADELLNVQSDGVAIVPAFGYNPP